MGRGEYLSLMGLCLYLCILLCWHTYTLFFPSALKNWTEKSSSSQIICFHYQDHPRCSACHESFYVWAHLGGFQFRAGSCPARSKHRQGKYVIFKQKACRLMLRCIQVSTSLKSNLQIADYLRSLKDRSKRDCSDCWFRSQESVFNNSKMTAASFYYMEDIPRWFPCSQLSP